MSRTAPRRVGARRHTLTAALALIALASLAACGGSSTSDAAQTGGDPDATLRISIPTDVTLPTILRFQATNQPLRRTVFEYLFDREADGAIKPYLATGYTWSDDKRSLVIELRDDVTYHDGRDFTAQDVVDVIKIAGTPEAGAQAAKLMSTATSIEATDTHQVTATFDEPSTNFLDGLAMLPMVDPKTYDGVADGTKVIGTGPFVYESHEAGRSLTYSRNDKYWGDKPKVAGVKYDIISEPSAQLAAVRSGTVDLGMRMIPRDVATLAKDPNFEIGSSEPYEVYLGVNTAVKPLDDVRVRQAIAYALDRDRIADQVYKGFAEPSSIAWSSTTPGVTDEMVTHWDRDLAKAKALIKDAGAEGTEIPFTAVAEPVSSAVFEIAKYNLEEIGLKPVNDVVEQAEFQQKNVTATFPGVWIADVALTTMGPPTALLTANPLLTKGNASNFNQPEWTKVLEARVGATEDEVSTTTAALTQYMLDQAFHISIAQQQAVFVHSKDVSGITADLTLALDLTHAEISR